MCNSLCHSLLCSTGVSVYTFYVVASPQLRLDVCLCLTVFFHLTQNHYAHESVIEDVYLTFMCLKGENGMAFGVNLYIVT